MQCYCKGGCYTEGLEEELDDDHIQREGGCLDCGFHRGIKMIDHVMKVLKRLVEKKVKSKGTSDSMQFGFTSAKGTTDAIFIVRQMQEKYLAKKKELWMAFLDLEKAFDSATGSGLVGSKEGWCGGMAHKSDTIHVRWSDNSSENEERRK